MTKIKRAFVLHKKDGGVAIAKFYRDVRDDDIPMEIGRILSDPDAGPLLTGGYQEIAPSECPRDKANRENWKFQDGKIIK